MVKVGFICEGATETEIVSSDNFGNYLKSISIERIRVIDAEGSGNLLPHNIKEYITILESAGAEKIVILTDLDQYPCITSAKNRVNGRTEDFIIIAVKQIESWFLANNLAMRQLLKDDAFKFENPENEEAPFETIRQLMISKTGRGIGGRDKGKTLLVRRLLNNNLQIELSATHPNCKSATYFINKLNSLKK